MLTKKVKFAVMFVLLLVAGAVQAGGDPVKGAELAIDCADCHGEGGKGGDNSPLAGLDEARHVELLIGYKSGVKGAVKPKILSRSPEPLPTFS